MADGTPIDVLESGGSVDHAADEARMAELMRDVNAVSGDLPPGPQTMNMAPVSAPPMRAQRSSAPPPAYTPMEEDYRPAPRRKNMWGSITEKLRGPLMVSIIVFVLSLPVLHTMLAKYAGWAFAVGGQLSWLGLIALSLLAGTAFGIGQLGMSILGL